MQLQSIKLTLASAWVSLIVILAVVIGVVSGLGAIAMTILGILPALGLLLLWRDPSPSLSESITKALR